MADEAHHHQRLPSNDRRTGKQYDVLEQRLTVSELDGIAEASAVAHRVGYPKPESNQRHHHHEGKGNLGSRPPVDGEEQEDSEAELHGREQHRGA